MYGIEIVTPAAAPIAAAALRARLRMNDASQDDSLAEFLGTAVEQFEDEAGRPVLATVYRQVLSRWPCGPIVLARGGVTAVGNVCRYLADGSAEELDPDTWRADLLTPPARVCLDATPEAVATASGATVTPVGYVEYTAGWPNASAVPQRVRTALMLLAGHFYRNREAFRDSAFEMRELPKGWASVVDRYRLGLTGDLGQ